MRRAGEGVDRARSSSLTRLAALADLSRERYILKRNLVVEVAAAARGLAAAAATPAASAIAAGAAVAAALLLSRARAAAARAAVEHGQLAAEALEHDLGRVFLGARLVGPFAGLELALDIDLRALLQEALHHIHQPVVEDHHAVPFGALAALAGGLVAPALGGRDRQVRHPGAVLEIADFGVPAEIAYEDHLIDAACHRSNLGSRCEKGRKTCVPAA